YRGFQRMVRTGRHKLILYPEVKKVQLFDLERDPWEMNNLADGSAHAATASEMFRELKKWQETISGRLGGKLDLCLAHRILAQDIEPVVAPYWAKTEIGGADWRCEYWGKWFTYLALADAWHSTPATRQ